LYSQFFGLEKLPFSIAPDPSFLYMSSRHQEGIAHLLYGINMGGGFVVLTGEVGTGKTTLCNLLLEQIPEDVDTAYILNPKLSAAELLASICDELEINYPESTNSLKVLNDQINKRLLETHAKGRRTVLIIDEAQNLSLEVLEQIRLLTNLETTTTKLLQIILIGQPELKDLLNNNKLRQLNQRITARYHLKPLSLQETKTYIEHRIRISGGRRGIFSSAALKQIFQLTRGIPRLINLLSDRSLLGAYSMETHTVSRAIVNKAAQEALPEQKTNNTFRKVIVFSTLLSLIPLIGYFGHYFPNSKQINQTKQLPLNISADSKIQQAKKAKVVQKVTDTKVEKTAEAIVIKPKEHKTTIEFSDFIKSPSLTIRNALNLSLMQWNIDIPENFIAECSNVQKVNLACLPGKTNWYQLNKMQRPVILEFNLANNEKRFALITRSEKNKITVLADHEYQFPLQDLMAFWNGYFMTLWKPPSDSFKLIYPGQDSSDIIWVRQRLNQYEGILETVSRPTIYDPNLEQRVKKFQREQLLSPDGLVGPLTAIRLQNATQNNDAPKLR